MLKHHTLHERAIFVCSAHWDSCAQISSTGAFGGPVEPLVYLTKNSTITRGTLKTLIKWPVGSTWPVFIPVKPENSQNSMLFSIFSLLFGSHKHCDWVGLRRDGSFGLACHEKSSTHRYSPSMSFCFPGLAQIDHILPDADITQMDAENHVTNTFNTFNTSTMKLENINESRNPVLPPGPKPR